MVLSREHFIIYLMATLFSIEFINIIATQSLYMVIQLNYYLIQMAKILISYSFFGVILECMKTIKSKSSEIFAFIILDNRDHFSRRIFNILFMDFIAFLITVYGQNIESQNTK